MISQNYHNNNSDDISYEDSEKFASVFKGKLSNEYCSRLPNVSRDDEKFELFLEIFESLFESINQEF